MAKMTSDSCGKALLAVWILAASALFAGAALIGTDQEKDPARQILSRELEPGQAVIWYLYHSGWAVKTKNHLLIFD